MSTDTKATDNQATDNQAEKASGADKRAKLVKMLAMQKLAKQKLAKPQLAGQNTPDADVIEAVHHTDNCYPLSYAQQRLWIISQIENSTAEYNLPVNIRVNGHFDLAACEASFAHIIERHQVLRSVYLHSSEYSDEQQSGGANTSDNNTLIQKVLPAGAFDLTVEDLTEHHLSGESQQQACKEALDKLMAEFAQRQFDLSSDVMLKACFVRLAPDAGILMINMHHIASDAHSLGLLVNEFSRIYPLFEQGLTATQIQQQLPALNNQYSDFAIWQQRFLSSQSAQQQLEYWQQQLADVMPVHQIPLDFPRPLHMGYQGQRHTLQLTESLSSKLLTQAKQLSLTPFMLFHCALVLLLARHGNQQQVVLGTPVTNRHGDKLAPLIGFFVNTLVLRANSDFSDFEQLAKHIKALNLAAMANQDVPFDLLLEKLNPTRSSAYMPLFQIMFTVQDNNASDIFNPFAHGFSGNNQGDKQQRSEQLSFEPMSGEQNVARFDLDITVRIDANNITIDWLYDSGIFTASHMSQMLEDLERLLSLIADDCKLPLAQWPYLGEQSRDLLLNQFNQLERYYPQHQRLEQIFAEQVKVKGHCDALVYNDQTISYQQLDSLSNGLACQLAKGDIFAAAGTDTPLIGVCMPRSIELIVSFLAVLKLGAAYVPLDCNAPLERLKGQIEDSQMKLVVHHSQWDVEKLSELTDVESLEVNWQQIGASSQFDVSKAKLTKDYKSLAYVMYTSGSTGKPKGVMISHQNIAQLVVNEPSVDITQDDCVVYCANPAFDASTWEIYCAILAGAKLLIVSDDQLLEPQALAQSLIDHKATVLQLTAGLLGKMSYIIGDTLSKLRYLLFGGDKADINAVVDLLKNHCPEHLVHTYGPTETVAFTTTFLVNDKANIDTYLNHGQLPIGKPTASSVAVILGVNGELLPIGTTGELYIGGDGVGVGYKGLREQTDERFVYLPILGEAGAEHLAQLRWYKTGDNARIDEHGNITFVERIDQQVKIRGFRIELGEIEQHILSHDFVDSCLVLVDQQVAKDKRILAYVKAGEAQHGEDLVVKLQSSLSQQLPAYMLPEHIMVVEQWPLTANGKIDRRALAAPNDVDPSQIYRQASNPLQQALVEIWAQVLRTDIKQIGIEQNFFSLGGNSLLAIGLISQIKQQLGIELTVKALFSAPTIELLALKLSDENQLSAIQMSAQAGIVDIPKQAKDGEHYPLSFAQQRLWFIDALQGHSREYNMPMALRVTGSFDVDMAEKVLTCIVARHQILRSRIISVPSEKTTGRQLICPATDFAINKQKLTDEQDVKTQIDKLIAGAFEHDFNLAEDAPLKVDYLALTQQQTQDKNSATNGANSGEGILVFNSHHIATDGWSMAVLFDEFIKLYRYFVQYPNATIKQAQASLPALPIQYADHAIWQKEQLQGQYLQKQLDYWQQQLADMPLCHSLPLDYPRPAIKGQKGAVVSQLLAPSLVDELQKRAQQLVITPFMLLHGALCLTLSRHSITGSMAEDIVIGTPVANRTHPDVRPLIGYFANTLVLRAQIDSQRPKNKAWLEQFFAQIKQVNLDAQDHQDVPFEQLVELLQLPRERAYTPLFQVMLSLDVEGQQGQNKDLANGVEGIDFTPLQSEQMAAKFDLNLGVRLAANEPETPQQSQQKAPQSVLMWTYDSQLFSHSHIEQINQDFIGLLTALCQFDLRDDNAILEAANPQADTLIALSQGVSDSEYLERDFVTLFNQQVANNPNACAVSLALSDEQLSYAQLGACSRALAVQLQSESKVGLLLPQGFEQVVAVVAALTAGITYVPMDISHPPKRIEQICQDAKINMLCVASKAQLPSQLMASIKNIDLLEVDIEQLSVADDKFTSYKANAAVRATDSAYVLYTSGSSGKPKGVEVSVGSLNNYLCYAQQQYLTQSDDGTKPVSAIMSTPLVFDATITSLLLPLQHGLEVIINPASTDDAIVSLAQTIAKAEQPLLLKLTPAHLKGLSQLLPDLYQQQGQGGLCQLAHKVVVGGEALTTQVAKDLLLNIWPNSLIYNEYGPTEATVGTCVFKLDKSNVEQLQSATVPIGLPINNTGVMVLDQQKQQVPLGAVGELYLTGPSLAKGYLNRDDLTTQSFVSIDGQTCYKTGDLVRWNCNFANQYLLEYLGRSDSQLKIRGFRIEAAEIEQHLIAMDEVAQAVAAVKTNQAGIAQLIGYLVLTENDFTDLQITSLKEHCRTALLQQLPAYMVPSQLVVIAKLPLTINGKVALDKLPLPSIDHSENDAQPIGEVEQAIAQIWAQLLSLAVKDIGRDSNFFAIGGDSIISIQVVSRAAALGLHFSVADMFEGQTIRTLAPLVKVGKAVQAPQTPSEGTMPLLPIAQSFLTANGAANHYNQALMLKRPANLTLAEFKLMFAALVKRHDSLRLRFALSDSGQWYGQFGHQAASLDEAIVQLVDQAVLPFTVAQFDAQSMAKQANEVQQSLDIEQGRLFAIGWFEQPFNEQGAQSDDGRILVAIHHLVVDGVSWRILVDDLNGLLNQVVGAKTQKPTIDAHALRLQEKTSSYQQWAKWLSAQSDKQWLVEQLPLWQQYSGVTQKPLLEKIQYQQSLSPTSDMQTHGFSLSKTLTGQLQTTALQAYDSQINELLLAALMLSAHQSLGLEQMSVAMEGHGREQGVFSERSGVENSLDLSQTVGWFTTTFPVALNYSDSQIAALLEVDERRANEIATTIASAKQQYRQIKHHGLGYGLLKHLIEDADASEPMVLFNYLGQLDAGFSQSSADDGASSLAEKQKQHWQIDTDISKQGESIGPNIIEHFGLIITCQTIAGQFGANLRFDANRFNSQVLQSWMAAFDSALVDVIEHCVAQSKQGDVIKLPVDYPLADVSLADFAQWQQQLCATNQHIVDIYPATGMQMGMLFHSMSDHSAYVSQTLMKFSNLDRVKFQQAWQLVANYHDVFRTQFVGIDTDKPHQLLLDKVDLDWHFENCQGSSANEVETKINLHRDWQLRHINVNQAPLMVFGLIELSQRQYQFIWSFHHALMDGWCLPLIFADVAQVYGHLLKSGSVTHQQLEQILPPKVSNRAYMQWLARQDMAQAKDYWRDLIAPFDEPTPLPFSYHKPSANDSNSIDSRGVDKSHVVKAHHQLNIEFDLAQSQAIEAKAKEAHTTVNVLLQGAWALLLSRFSAKKQVMFGAVTSGRPPELKGVEQMLGLFINTVPVAADVDGQQSLAGYFNGLHKQMVQAQSYAHLATGQIEQLSDFKASLFDSLLVFENYPLNEQMFAADEAQPEEQALQLEQLEAIESTNYGICLSAQMRGQLTLKWQVKTDLIDKAQLAQLAEHFSHILIELTQLSFDKPINAIDMLAPQQKHQLLVRSQGKSQLTTLSLAHQQVEAQVEKTPDAIAVIDDNTTMSYQQLNTKANQLANLLRASGVGIDCPVGIYLSSCVETAVAVLAILKAGGAYVPLDVKHPAKRLGFICADAKVKHLICGLEQLLASQPQVSQPQDLDKIEHIEKTCGAILFDLSSPELQQQLNSDPQYQQNLELLTDSKGQAQGPDSLAYIVYTSGSTGQPKGVALPHQLLTNLIPAMSHHSPRLGEPLAMAQFASFGFDMSVTDMFMTWLSGGSLHFIQNQLQMDIGALASWLIDKQIERLNLPFAVLAQLALVAQEQQLQFNQLKVVISTAEGLRFTPAIVAFFARHPDCQLINHYGPSETHVVSAEQMKTPPHSWRGDAPIGQLLENVHGYILDANRQLVPDGGVGHLYVGGLGVGRGYLDKPQLTDERFIYHDFDDGNGLVRLYDTGDLASFSGANSNTLRYHGRKDMQIKIRGFRIEIGEIEQQLLAHPAVAEASVIATELNASDEQAADLTLIAYTVLKADLSVDSDELIGHLKDALPYYMVPRHVVKLAKMPLNANGKVDKNQLPLPDVSAVKPLAPANSIELQLLSICAQLLKLNAAQISMNDNFFDLGGHSLLVVRLVTQIEHQIGCHCTIEQVFEAADLLDLAATLTSQQSLDDAKTPLSLNRPAIVPVAYEYDQNGGAMMPLSYAQQRLWFVDKLEGGSAQYNLPLALNIDGDFCIESAEKALCTIVQRHGALRSLYVEHQGQPMQYVLAKAEFKLSLYDLTEQSETEQRQQVNELVLDDAKQVFDLANELVIRASFIKLQSGSNTSRARRGVLLVNIHHIASDGWSSGILFDEFIRLYRAYSQGETLELPTLDIQYADFASWQRQWLEDEQLAIQHQYWQQQLAGLAKVHALPLDYKRPAQKRYLGAMVSTSVDRVLYQKIEKAAKNQGLTVFMLLHSALVILLSRHSNFQGQSLQQGSDIVIGTSSANRLAAGLENIIGFFVNTLVLRVNAQAQNVASLLAQVRKVNLEAQSNQDVSFEQLVELAAVERSGQISPLFQIMLNVNNNQSSDLSIEGVSVTPIESGLTPAKFDIEIIAELDGGQGQISWVYDTDIFAQDHMEQMAEHYGVLLDNLTDVILQGDELTQQTDIGAINIFAPEQLAKVEINQLPETVDYGGSDKHFIAQFESQVASYGDKVCLRLGEAFADGSCEQSYTYCEINQQANQLAHGLIERGISRDDLVAICIEPGLDMLVAIIAIGKAGGAYLPIDPHFPFARIEGLLIQAQPKLVLSDMALISDLELNELEDVTVLPIDLNMRQMLFASVSCENPEVVYQADFAWSQSLAYVIFTSGSTGQPKGVKIHHGGLSHYLNHAQQQYFADDAIEVAVTSTILSFDATVTSLLAPLTCARAVHLLPIDENIISALAKLMFIDDGVAKLFKLTPSHLQALAIDSGASTCQLAHQVIIGGEALSIASLKPFTHSLLPNGTFVNEYGPTETVVGCVTYTIDSAEQLDELSEQARLSAISEVPIGLPINHCQVLILNADGQLQPDLTIGELYIGGDGVGLGYLNRDDLTEQSFVDISFAQLGLGDSTDTRRFYRSGDLVRRLANGQLLFVGRADEQIKIRGYRIESGEVKQQLLELEGIEGAEVMLRDDQAGHSRLVAYVVASHNSQPWLDVKEDTSGLDDEQASLKRQQALISYLRRQLAQQLPQYMMPDLFMPVDGFKTTLNGKVDYQRLPMPDSNHFGGEHVSPTTPLEQQLADIWALTLGISATDISTVASFFDIGGHSLLAVKMLADIREQIGVEVEIRTLFEHPQINTLAEFIDALLVKQQLQEQQQQATITSEGFL